MPDHWSNGIFRLVVYCVLSSWMSFQMRCRLPIVKLAAGLNGDHVPPLVESQLEPNTRLSGCSLSAIEREAVQSKTGDFSEPSPSISNTCLPLNCSVSVERSVYCSVSSRV